MMRYGEWRKSLSCLLLSISLAAGCDTREFLSDDLAMAREASMERDWPVAERLLERYLRTEQNPQKRWEAWELMLKALNADRPEPRASLECLEAMLVEYDNDEGKVALILTQMGKYNEQLRRYDRAANAWSAYLDLGDITSKERVEGYRRLAAMQFSQRHFEAGESTLQECLALPLSDHDKIYCMLDLADENMTRERWREVADLCEQIMDAEPDDAVRGMAGYLRGDALEQMGQREDALRQFEDARDSYPNPAVMDNRINHLKKAVGKSGQERQ